MIGTIDVEIMAANPSMPLYPVRAFKNSPSSIRLRNVPKHIGNWNITSVQIVAAYPDSSIKTASCVLVGGVWVGTIEGCPISGRSENGFTVFASGIDENGNPVSNYVLGKGLIEILEGDGTITPDAPSYYVHLLGEEPTTPKEGDLWPTTDGYAIWQNGESHNIGLTSSDVVSIVTAEKTIGVGDNWQNYVDSTAKPFWTPEESKWGWDDGFDYLETNAPEDSATLEFQGYYFDEQGFNIKLRVMEGSEPDVDIFYYEMPDGNIVEAANRTFTYNDGEYTAVGDQSTWEVGNYYSFTVVGHITYKLYRDSKTVNALGLATEAELNAKQDALTTAQLSAVNSGITASKVSTYDGYASQITTAQSTATDANNLATALSDLVPPQASTSNQLADKAFVNSSIQTATANFRGNWATWNDVPTDANDYPVDYAGNKTPTVNDYLVVQDASGYVGSQTLEGTWRFKYSGAWATDGKSGWLPEYQVNETPMTAAQLAAINSNITAAKVAQYDEALTKFNYELYAPMRETMTLRQDIFPITYTDNNTTYTVQYSDYGTTLTVVETSTLGASSTSIYLAHNNGTTNSIIVSAVKTTGLCAGGILSKLNVKLNGSTPAIGTTPIYDVSGGLVLKNRAINIIPLS